LRIYAALKRGYKLSQEENLMTLRRIFTADTKLKGKILEARPG